MGGGKSKEKVEEEFEVYQIDKEGNALVKSKQDGKQYLMRVVNCASEADMDRLKALLECRARLKSPHILELVEIKEKQQDFLCSVHFKMYLVLEYSSNSLAQQIKQRSSCQPRDPFQESHLWSILYSCCSALSVLYSNGATHESLSAKQVFINQDGFVKIAEPLLFGLEKNHLQAMRGEEGSHLVHLSPQIIGCIDDQNFFYYDKEKSDVFVLGMIIIDAALLSNNYLYNPKRKLPLQENLEEMLGRVRERYSSSLVGVLREMVKVEARTRATFQQVIERVEKYNNVGEDYTVQSESNIKSNQNSYDRGSSVPDKPLNYQTVVIYQQFNEGKKKTQPIAPQFYSNGLINQQQSLSIKEPSFHFNNQTFDGRVFASTSHHSNFHSGQGVFSTYQQEASILTPGPVLITERIISKPQQNLNLYQRSRSIDSIKVVSNEYTREAAKVLPSSANKQPQPSFQSNYEMKSVKKEIIFTHQIPQVYNLLVRNSASAKIDQLAQEKPIPQSSNINQFQGQSNKVIRFTSFKNFPGQSISRSGEKQPQSPYPPKEPQRYQQPFTSFKQVPNPFSSFTPLTPLTESPKKASIQSIPKENNSVSNSSPIVSASFIPSQPRQLQSFTCHSAFSHLSQFQKDNQDVKLQFVREEIPERGRYQGYKFNDEKNGHGTLYFKDGGHYSGEWKNDKMHGFGKLYYENGKIAYEGHWENDEFNGQGRVYNSDPVLFQEQFNYRDFSQLCNNWIYYQGQFKNDSKHGKGYIKLTNGQMFQGIFDHDMIEGNGIFYKRGGEIIIGFWIDNKLFLNQSYEHDKK